MTIPAAAQCDLHFRPLLADFEAAALESASGAVIGLWSDLTLAFRNPAWFQFVVENGGEPEISQDLTLGSSILEAIRAPLRPFFAGNYRRSLQEGRPWVHAYKCSPDEVHRRFHMKVFPLRNSEGLLQVNSRCIDSVQQHESLPSIEEQYRNEHGLMTQCSHCRRFRRVGEQSTWDWVRTWVEKVPQKTSDAICKTCAGFYYADDKFNDDLPKIFSTVSG